MKKHKNSPQQTPAITLGGSESAMGSKWMFVLLLILINSITWQGVRHNTNINLDDKKVKSDQLIRDLSSENFWKILAEYPAEYPVARLSHAVAYHFIGPPTDENLGCWHLMSVLIHTMSTLLVFVFLRMIPGMKLEVAFFIAALWAVVPLKVENVAWIFERRGQLYGLFTFASLVTFIQYFRAKELGKVFQSRIFYGATLLLFILGILSKAMMVSLPLALILVDYVMNRKISFRQNVTEKFLFFALAGIGGVMAFNADYSENPGTTLVRTSTPIVERFFVGSYAIILYMIKTVTNHNLHIHYGYPQSVSVIHFVSAVIVILSIVITWRNRDKLSLHKIFVFGLGFFIVCIVFVAFFPAADVFFAERHMYVPSLGVVMGIVYLVEKISDHFRFSENLRRIFLSACVVLLSIGTYARIPFWKNSERLFLDQVEKEPNNDRGSGHLAEYYYEIGEYRKAISFAEESFALGKKPENISVKARCFLEFRPDSAIIFFKEYLRYQKPDSALIYAYLGSAYGEIGYLDTANIFYGQALDLVSSPYYENRKMGITGTIMLEQVKISTKYGMFNSATSICQSVVGLAKTYGLSEIESTGMILGHLIKLGSDSSALGESLVVQKKSPESIKAFFLAYLKAHKHDPVAQGYLGYSYALLGVPDSADYYFKKAIRVESTRKALVYEAWIVAMMKSSRKQDALIVCQDCLREKNLDAKKNQELRTMCDRIGQK